MSEQPDTMPPADLAVLLGVAEEDIHQLLEHAPSGRPQLPAEWIRQGRRRAREYQAWTGDSDIRGAVTWWRNNPNPNGGI